MSKRCDNCEFIHWEHEGAICRRYPPVYDSERGGSYQPNTNALGLCGEWKLLDVRFNELLTKTLNGDMTDAEAIEYQTLSVERIRHTSEREALQLGELAKVAAGNAKLIRLLTDDVDTDEGESDARNN